MSSLRDSDPDCCFPSTYVLGYGSCVRCADSFGTLTLIVGSPALTRRHPARGAVGGPGAGLRKLRPLRGLSWKCGLRTTLEILSRGENCNSLCLQPLAMTLN